MRSGGTRPTRAELRTVLEDYLGSIAIIAWKVDRFYVMLQGDPTFPFQRVGPATDCQRGAWRERVAEGDIRAFEVWVGDDCIDVMTRHADDYTNDVADGYAKLCARAWGGEIER